ncbi:hypothetical protein IQ62_10360 [Streptomyces scabiei]|uniref:hypothetical protein n=1 Tax=Streptomyces scabiei TaxID=1930 RepID=UPI0004E63CAF|nr:hypothetical protein [Streptomyces scabiei]KFG01014.1 hypothetical protein IQ62_10360 [Streptomyces scabiei]
MIRTIFQSWSSTFNGWSVRTDVPPPAGLKPIWKQTFALSFGEVKGDPTPGRLGLHPGAWRRAVPPARP